MSNLDELIRKADPAIGINDETVERRVLDGISASRRSRPSTPRPWWTRAKVAIPAGVGVLALITGAAVVIPMQLQVDETPVEVDLQLPVSYTTSSGEDITCTYGIYFGEPEARPADLEEAIAELSSQDWSSFGDQVYQHATEHPVTPQDGEVWTVDSQEVRDKMSFELAVSAVVLGRLPSDLASGMPRFAGTTDCMGQLH